jgi:hypothetical protein
MRNIVERWLNGGTEFKYAKLDCGHDVRLTKQYAWEHGALVPCGECPRKKR